MRGRRDGSEAIRPLRRRAAASILLATSLISHPATAVAFAPPTFWRVGLRLDLPVQMAEDRVPWPNRRPPPDGDDMAFVKENVERQALNYKKIRDAGGIDCARDIYVRNHKINSFWYVGKVAYCTGTVTLQEAVARQLKMIEEHATRLRPVELGRSFGSCEVWAAPADTEFRMSQNDPDVRLVKMDRYVEGCENIDSSEVGLMLEVVTNRGVGFFVERDNNGIVPPHLMK